jgi:hypothetical protein
MEANTDPDTDTDPDPIRIQGFNDQKLEKNNSRKKIYFFFDQTAIYLSLGLYKNMSRLQKKPPAHKRGHPTLQNMNFFYFCGSFLPSWIRIRIQITDPDPDPMGRLNTDPDTDPDPKPW